MKIVSYVNKSLFIPKENNICIYHNPNDGTHAFGTKYLKISNF